MAKDRVDRDDEDLVRLYLTDIGQYTLLTKDDEVRLAKAIEAGKEAAAELEAVDAPSPARKRELRRTVRKGREAERTFVQSNLRLVVSIAKKYQASGLPLLDLIQEGNLGLMHAVEKFDWRKGFKFSTYATWWIRQAITRGIANTGRTIRLPVHAGDTLARLQKARARLELKYGRPATLSELSAEVEMPEDKVTAIEELVTQYGTVAMIGDGVNDAPAMARAHYGIAMGAVGSDAAIETADIALMTDDIGKVPWLIGHSRRTMAIIKQNIGLSLATKAAFVVATAFGMASMWGAIAADVGVSLLVVANALRLLRARDNDDEPRGGDEVGEEMAKAALAHGH